MLRLPFHRDVQITAPQARLICRTLQHAARAGSVLCVAPEHRLSLQLKCTELHQDSIGKRRVNDHARAEEIAATAKALDCVERAVQFYDLFDESDALLSHR
jgi:hypothetical protein